MTVKIRGTNMYGSVVDQEVVECGHGCSYIIYNVLVSINGTSQLYQMLEWELETKLGDLITPVLI